MVRCHPPPTADVQDGVRVEQIVKGAEVMGRERGEDAADYGECLIGFAHSRVEA
jgi:hypothetical protein